jgi:type II secretory pathway pseudopilin PulG
MTYRTKTWADTRVEMKPPHCGLSAAGFSLLEMLASVVIMLVLLGAVFAFLFQVQKKMQGSQVVSESNQTARAAMELMTQEIGQAGFNPQFANTKTFDPGGGNYNGPNAAVQCITLSDIKGINPGDWVGVDSGANYEVVQVLETSTGSLPSYSACTGANQIGAIFTMYHDNLGTPPHGSTLAPNIPVTSYKFPYPGGIVKNRTESFGATSVSVSNDRILSFYGDINNDGNIYYVVYSLYNPTSGTPQTVTIPGSTQTYYLYTLYRSITPVTFSDGQTNQHASPLVHNVIYQDITTSTPTGPTGQPLFSYPAVVSVAIRPVVASVVGTVQINLCVAVNPQSMEAGGVTQWYTMASQIRPMNLWAAVTVNSTGASKYLSDHPRSIPLAFPSTLSNYYF